MSIQNKNERRLTFVDAIREGLDQVLAADSAVFLMGLGVPDPKNIFGSTSGLREKYGPKRVFDMPISENGVTGILIGSAIVGMRPILVHQRIDFSLYSMDQIVNNAAKWYSMFGGQRSVPLVIRMIIGRGWGQGNQHSQNLSALYAHVPGLKVIVPSSAYTAKGLLISAVRDNNPVIFIEHRWLHQTASLVPEESYELPLERARVLKMGTDITIASWSYMTIEVIKAAEALEEQGVSVEVIDMQCLRPIDFETLKKSVKKTQRLLVVDEAWRSVGVAGELIARVAEDVSVDLKCRPQRLTNPDFPSPSTPALCRYYYVQPNDIFKKVAGMLSVSLSSAQIDQYVLERVVDVPDPGFKELF